MTPPRGRSELTGRQRDVVALVARGRLTAIEIHALSMSLRYGMTNAASRMGQTVDNVNAALSRLAIKVGVGIGDDHKRGNSMRMVQSAIALGWLRIPPLRLAEGCPVHGDVSLQADGRRYCSACAAERRLSDARLRRGGLTCQRGHPRTAEHGKEETRNGAPYWRCVTCRRRAARERYRATSS